MQCVCGYFFPFAKASVSPFARKVVCASDGLIFFVSRAAQKLRPSHACPASCAQCVIFFDHRCTTTLLTLLLFLFSLHVGPLLVRVHSWAICIQWRLSYSFPYRKCHRMMYGTPCKANAAPARLLHLHTHNNTRRL